MHFIIQKKNFFLIIWKKCAIFLFYVWISFPSLPEIKHTIVTQEWFVDLVLPFFILQQPVLTASLSMERVINIPQYLSLEAIKCNGNKMFFVLLKIKNQSILPIFPIAIYPWLIKCLCRRLNSSKEFSLDRLTLSAHSSSRLN